MATQSLVTQNAIETISSNSTGRSLLKSLVTSNAIETFSGNIDGRGLMRYELSTQNGVEDIISNISGRMISNHQLITTDAVETIDTDGIIARSMLIRIISNPVYENVTSKYILANYTLLDLVDLAVTVEPGETLIIDSEDFTVTKDNEDITFVHSGDWIDAVNRDTDLIALQIESGSSTITTEINFAERYL